MTTQEIVDRIKSSKHIKKKIMATTVRHWALKNGVAYTGEGRRKDYIFTEDDYQRFLNREKPGRRWE